MKTAIPSPEDIDRHWHLIDAEDAVLGRVASKAAMVLMGKHKPSYTPFLDTGDHVVVVNAAKVRLTGRKEEQKLYRRHSGYPGGLTETSAQQGSRGASAADGGRSDPGNASENEAGQADVPEVAGLCGPQASA